jgi:hypothetical protein
VGAVDIVGDGDHDSHELGPEGGAVLTTFTTPRTWADGEKPSTLLLNPGIRDNLLYLKPRVGRMVSDLSSSDSGTWMRPPELKIATDVGAPRYWYVEFHGLTVIADVASFFVDADDFAAGKSGVINSNGNFAPEAKGIVSQYDIFQGADGACFKWWGVYQDAGAGYGMIPQFLPYTGVNCTIKAGTTIKAWQID